MVRDKKNRGGQIRFVLPRDFGELEIVDHCEKAEIMLVLEAAKQREEV